MTIVEALAPEARRLLARVAPRARVAAERAARDAIHALGVFVDRPSYLSDAENVLRLALRARARQLGGEAALVEACGYAQWHRMFFARVLADNGFLFHPEHDVQVSLDDCREIAREAGEGDQWTVAASFASASLPGIFPPSDPLTSITFAPEHLRTLEAMLEELPKVVSTSEDGIGWFYQFWQSDRKDEVNRSEQKIGGAELPAVTQLFTEPYMVRFLLENSLGAWWAARHPDSPLVASWDYLRLGDDGSPIAGRFDGWPQRAAEVTMIDPCCGSGHFLVRALDMLTRMRAEEEALNLTEACDAVLRDNLHGLELDPRCLQIAAFAIVLHAWRLGGHRELPLPAIACSGTAITATPEERRRLAGVDERLRLAVDNVATTLAQGPELGSLINPHRIDGVLSSSWEDVARAAVLLTRGLADDPVSALLGAEAAGAARALELLAGRYTLVATNVPYLQRRQHTEQLKAFADRNHPSAKNDLASMMLERCRALAARGGAVATVSPQAWLTLKTYERFRLDLLRLETPAIAARLGPGAFREVSGEVVKPVLLVTQLGRSGAGSFGAFPLDDVAGADAKDEALRAQVPSMIQVAAIYRQPESRIVFGTVIEGALLDRLASGYAGVQSGDYPRFGRCFWELELPRQGWALQLSTSRTTTLYGGREHAFFWEDGCGTFFRFVEEKLGVGKTGAWIRGKECWGRSGVAVSQMGSLPVTLYTGELFDNNTAVIVPTDPALVRALWAFCSSPEFNKAVRAIDQKMNVTNATLVKVPFDEVRWRQVADEQGELPAPASDDPTQWLFDGGPARSTAPLQVALARLCGYRWPAQDDASLGIACEPDPVAGLADTDSVVAIPPLLGERAAADRLREVLVALYGAKWSESTLSELLQAAGAKDLERWLRDGAFAAHCVLFHQRPFLWQVWDGRADGFSCFVLYHRLDHALLEKVIYTYLGEWIRQQRAAVQAGAVGADLRLGAALDLERRLRLILEGEPPYDIYVRWRPRAEQAIGWHPNLDDGVRMNIRPFVAANVLRSKPNIKWEKDRGKEPDGSDRINDLHLTHAEKRAAQERLQG